MKKGHRCDRCGSTFSSEKGLKQHMGDKHRGYYLARRISPIAVSLAVISIALLFLTQTPFWGPPSTSSGGEGDVLEGALTGHEDLAMHMHSLLEIYVDGERLTIPAGIGILSDGRMRYIHTHDSSGQLHIEAPFKRGFTLGDFFRIWGKKLDNECLDNYCGKVGVTVNGEPYIGDPRGIVLRDRDVIVINVLSSGTQLSGDAEVGVQEGMLAPDFKATTLEGRSISLSDLRGRTVVLWFMATWCPSCAAVGPIIRDNQAEDTVVIVVDMWTEPVLKEAGLLDRPGTPPPERGQDLSRFISTYGDADWVLILDEYGLTRLYELQYVDTTFVIGPDGRIELRSDGPVSSSLLKFAIQKTRR